MASLGSVTAPVPTCPPPSVPGVGVVLGVVALLCATAGAAVSKHSATRARIVFIGLLYAISMYLAAPTRLC